MSRSLRGLYVIRGGFNAPGLTRAGKDVTPDGPDDEPDDDEKQTDSGSGLGLLRVDFSVFNTFYRIDSMWEGTFMEQIAPGAFKKTMQENGGQTKILFDHGMDMNIGDKPLAVVSNIGEAKNSAFLEGDLLDTSYNRDLAPGLRAGAYGSSFMFEALDESWNYEPEASATNPDGIPERTINQVRLFEAGPVTWPANPAATAGLRSGADWIASKVRDRDESRYAELDRKYAAFRTLNNLRTSAEAAQGSKADAVVPTPDVQSGRHVMSKSERSRKLFLLNH